MTHPNDPWAARPEGRPTEQLGRAPQPTEPLRESGHHTADAYQAYGGPPNGTMPYPTYDALLREQAHNRLGYPGAMPRYAVPAPRRRSTGALVAAGVGLGLVLAAVAGAAIMLLRSPDDGATTALPSESAVTQSPQFTQSPDEQLPVQPGPFGDPSPGIGLCATVGSITATDGVTLSVQGVVGEHTAIIRTNAQTRVLATGGAAVSDLKVGDVVIVQGVTGTDGSITAHLIISTSFGK